MDNFTFLFLRLKSVPYPSSLFFSENDTVKVSLQKYSLNLLIASSNSLSKSQVILILSSTEKPASFLIFCTCRTRSLTIPSWISSLSNSRVNPTVMPPPLTAEKPYAANVSIIISSLCKVYDSLFFY